MSITPDKSLPFKEGFIGSGESEKIPLALNSKTVTPESLSEYSEDYYFFFLNTLHIYLGLNEDLFLKYCSEFPGTSMDVLHFELPGKLLDERVAPIKGKPTPPEGWSRFIQGVPKEQGEDFKDWLLASGWIYRDSKGNPSVYKIFSDDVSVLDPVKVMSKKVIGIRDRVDLSFFLPEDGSGRIRVDPRNGIPYNVRYIQRTAVRDHVDPFGVNPERT